MGTSISVVGTYSLTGEISKYGAKSGKAFEEYDKITMPFVHKAQKWPLKASAIANSESV